MHTITTVLAHHGISDAHTFNGVTFTGEATAIDNAREAGIIRVCLTCASVMGIDMTIPGTTEDNRSATRDALDYEALAYCCEDEANTFVL